MTILNHFCENPYYSVLNCASDRLAVSSLLSCIFSAALSCYFILAIFFCLGVPEPQKVKCLRQVLLKGPMRLTVSERAGKNAGRTCPRVKSLPHPHNCSSLEESTFSMEGITALVFPSFLPAAFLPSRDK